MEWNRKKVSVGNTEIKNLFGSESNFTDLNLEPLTFACDFFLCERNSDFFKEYLERFKDLALF